MSNVNVSLKANDANATIFRTQLPSQRHAIARYRTSNESNSNINISQHQRSDVLQPLIN